MGDYEGSASDLNDRLVAALLTLTVTLGGIPADKAVDLYEHILKDIGAR